VSELDPQHPGDPGRSAPAGRKGIVPTRAQYPTTSTEGDTIMPFSKEMTHGTLPNLSVTCAEGA
jgi:hypothetical protein